MTDDFPRQNQPNDFQPTEQTANDIPLYQSRRQYQESLRRRQKRRQARMRRLRALMGVRFWTRAAITIGIGICLVFWAKFAFVYDIPTNFQASGLSNLSAYVTLKPWWFGPPAFDLLQTETSNLQPYLSPDESLLQGLGRYSAVVTHPDFIWVMKR
ncbi:hypothetical protein [Alicyclobacillus ferrooxydans]|uniref:hypothetical protein n=1 Tax=Alicyclobacillus ferrooxydans TaxID=471514 RepID=UPI0006D53C84|nr:hypothetical protein [Alicyclobacillus ferrooxydans]